MIHNLIETVIYLVFAVFIYLNQALKNLWDSNYYTNLWELITLSSGALNPSYGGGVLLRITFVRKR